MTDRSPLFLLVRAAPNALVAIPMAAVLETLRPLPVEPLSTAPAFVLGASVIRGEPVPVLDLARLLSGLAGEPPRRFVTLRAGSRQVALAVPEVLGLASLAPLASPPRPIPPLLQSLESRSVEELGVLDRDLLAVLGTAKLVPAEVWAEIESVRRPA